MGGYANAPSGRSQPAAAATPIATCHSTEPDTDSVAAAEGCDRPQRGRGV
ncbi:hypothetical protein C4K22_0927 [Pseudomonas chlororaphis subsp. aurantiaca]|nr:hypothetical protein C4K22_0927 [Pseudomonas chlororaphis subsp. aurantiaca]AZD40020.1 hypothetical protein C4K21_0927 [Pseudomonas chlororaphis subsp. aurantiaca]AZD77492.1 hypothetical protein C4K15_0906 [Pseudomonas chlororaphis subsp. aurantiaca]